jgi:hypothetical protein
MAASNSFVIGTRTYIERKAGIYTLSTNSFGSLIDEIRVRPNTNPKQPSITLTRSKQITVIAPNAQGVNVSKTVPYNVSVTISTVNNEGVTPTMLAAAVSDINTLFGNLDNITSTFQGSTNLVSPIGFSTVNN